MILLPVQSACINCSFCDFALHIACTLTFVQCWPKLLRAMLVASYFYSFSVIICISFYWHMHILLLIHHIVWTRCYDREFIALLCWVLAVSICKLVALALLTRIIYWIYTVPGTSICLQEWIQWFLLILFLINNKSHARLAIKC